MPIIIDVLNCIDGLRKRRQKGGIRFDTSAVSAGRENGLNAYQVELENRKKLTMLTNEELRNVASAIYERFQCTAVAVRRLNE